jgi:hypothetical protein
MSETGPLERIVLARSNAASVVEEIRSGRLTVEYAEIIRSPDEPPPPELDSSSRVKLTASIIGLITDNASLGLQIGVRRREPSVVDVGVLSRSRSRAPRDNHSAT